MIQMNLSVKQTHRYGEKTYGGQEGRVGRGRIAWELGISRCKLLYIYIERERERESEWRNNTVLLWSTGNAIQYPVINHHGMLFYINVISK